MRSGVVFGVFALSLAGAFGFASGCKSKAEPQADASVPSTPAAIARGEYLVKAVAGCGECHTPRDASGKLDMAHWLGGVTNRFDLAPEDDTLGGISAPNLTPHGLAAWTDAQIKNAIVNGRDDDGAILFPLMPYYVFHNMTDDDVDAIVAYLRTVPASDMDTPKRQPLPASVAMTAPAEPVPEAAIPHTTLKPGDSGYSHAENGRYLAAQVGFCMDCHTPWRAGFPQPLDLNALFAGGRTFSSREWVVPAPAPSVIYSNNVTPDGTGIQDWSAQMVATALKVGTDDQGATLCRPMPSGAMGAFGNLTDSDAIDIGVYLTTLPPIASSTVPECAVPGPRDGGADADIPDTSAPDTSGPDTSAPDTSAPDTSAPDAGIDDASDAADAGDGNDASGE